MFVGQTLPLPPNIQGTIWNIYSTYDEIRDVLTKADDPHMAPLGVPLAMLRPSLLMTMDSRHFDP